MQRDSQLKIAIDFLLTVSPRNALIVIASKYSIEDAKTYHESYEIDCLYCVYEAITEYFQYESQLPDDFISNEYDDNECGDYSYDSYFKLYQKALDQAHSVLRSTILNTFN